MEVGIPENVGALKTNVLANESYAIYALLIIFLWF